MKIIQFLKKENTAKYVPLILRLGLGAVFVYFGIDKFTNPEANLALVESIGIPFTTIAFIFFLGIVELITGGMLLIGLFTRAFAGVAALMLFSIIISFGFTNVPRDLGLFAMALSLIILGGGKMSIDARLYAQKYNP